MRPDPPPPMPSFSDLSDPDLSDDPLPNPEPEAEPEVEHDPEPEQVQSQVQGEEGGDLVETPMDPPLLVGEITVVEEPQITPLQAVEPLPTFPSAPPTSPQDVISGLLPAGRVHLLSGAPGAGKSTLIAQLLAWVSQGEPVFGHPSRSPAFIGVVTSDRCWQDHQPWFDRAGISGITHYSMVNDPKITGKHLRSSKYKMDRFDLLLYALSKLVDPLPQDSLVILDPISFFLGGNPLDYDRVHSHLLDLNRFAWEHTVTFLGNAHAGKQKGDKRQRYTRAQDRIVGTTAQTGAAGTSMHMAPPEETEKPYSELTIMPRFLPPETHKLVRAADGLFIPYDDTEVEVETIARSSTPVPLQLLGLLPEDGTPLEMSTIVGLAKAQLRIGRSTTYKALAALEQAGEIVSVKHGWWGRQKGN